MQTCVGCRGYSDLLLKVSGGRIISSYLLPLSKPLSAHLAPPFPLLSLLWKLNHVSDAARAAKARCGGRDRDGGTGGARRRQRFAVEPSRSCPASRQALSHGTSWNHSHIFILTALVPDPVELNIVWSMGFAWREPEGQESPPGLPTPLLTPKATLHLHPWPVSWSKPSLVLDVGRW